MQLVEFPAASVAVADATGCAAAAGATVQSLATDFTATADDLTGEFVPDEDMTATEIAETYGPTMESLR